VAAIQTDRSPRTSRWRWLAGASAGFVVLVGAAGLIWWAASRETRTTTYAVRGSLEAITLDLGQADVTVVGAGGESSVGVRHVDEFAFGRPPETTRRVVDGELRLRSRCPDAILNPCSSSYRVSVPDNIPLTVLTSSGDVRFDGVRGSVRVQTGSGDVLVESYCGFALNARADMGNVRVTAACAPERLDLRSRAGDVRVLVPQGRYQVDADSDAGPPTIRGVVQVEDSPFQVVALSDTGAVVVEASP
jgi:hypothetical protein